jgi:ribonuclease-3
LFEFSEKIELSRYILLGKGEESSGGRERPSIVSDAFEAVIAAVYLDGGAEAARRYVIGFIPEKTGERDLEALRDYKTILEEIVQRNPDERVEYHHFPPSGPDHNRWFFVEVLLSGNPIGRGEGHSKKQAEQMAAKEAIAWMGRRG